MYVGLIYRILYALRKDTSNYEKGEYKCLHLLQSHTIMKNT